jgi:signal transduction histidine kinase
MTGIPDSGQPRRTLLSDAAVYLAIAVVSVLHYVSPMRMHALHDVYRRLYYLPIIFAAFLHGVSGGLVAATVVTLAYIPHAFGRISHDPATTTQKVLEIVLYYAVGLTTGGLVSRLRGTQQKLEQTAQDLLQSIQQLRTAEVQLLQAARLAAVGRLSAGLAHEIRNPLAAIKGSAEILSDDFPDGHPKRRLLQILVEESVRLNNVLARFLAFARPRPLEEQEFDLVKEIEAVVSLLEGQNAARTIRYTLELPTSPTKIRGDRERLRQVFLNVLLNASEAAGQSGEVTIRCDTADKMCRIEVRDSGVGFTKEAIENAFTPFFTTKEQGSGLGLAVSHRIIEQHGGAIRIGNHERGGGRVEILIPSGRRDG